MSTAEQFQPSTDSRRPAKAILKDLADLLRARGKSCLSAADDYDALADGCPEKGPQEEALWNLAVNEGARLRQQKGNTY